MRRLTLPALALLLLGSLTSQAAAAATIMDVLKQDGRFSTFIDLLRRSDLDQLTMARGPYTVFAPTDAAFARLAPAHLAQLQAGASNQSLTDWVGRLILSGEVTSRDVAVPVTERKSVIGTPVHLARNTQMTMDGVTVAQPDVAAQNGIVHVLEAVPIK